MSTIKISQLGNVSAFTDETIIPVVANVAGTLTTLKTDGDTLKTFVLGTVETDIANTSANVTTLQGNIVTLSANVTTLFANVTTLFSNAATQAGQISNITSVSIPLINSDIDNLQSNLSAVTSEVETLSGNVSYLLSTADNLTANVNTLIANAEVQSGFISNITNGTATFSNLIPSADVTYDLGSETARWKDLWLSGDTINLGGSTISQAGGAIVFSALPGVDLGLRNVIGWQDYANDVNIAIGDSYTIDSTMGTWGDLGNPGPGPYLDGAVPGIRYAFGNEPAVPAEWAFTYDVNGFVDTITLVSAGDPIDLDDQFEFVWFPNVTSTITPVYLGEASTDPIDTTDTIWNADGKELYINRDAGGDIVSVTGTGWTGADIIPGGLDGRFAILTLPDDSVVFDGIDGPSIGAEEDCFALSFFIVTTETAYAPVATTSDIPILANVATTGNFNDLNNLPVLGNVAFTDDYNDLINTPNLAAIGDFVMANTAQWTSNVFTFDAAVNQLAERIVSVSGGGDGDVDGAGNITVNNITANNITANTLTIGRDVIDGGDGVAFINGEINVNYDVTTISIARGDITISGDILAEGSVTTGNLVAGDFVNYGQMQTANLILDSNYVPSEADSFGLTGQIVWDTGYVYICVAENTWKRANIATW
jgi:hypothetical protein